MPSQSAQPTVEQLQVELAEVQRALQGARILVERVPMRTLVRCFHTHEEHEAFRLLLKETIE